MVLTNGHVRRQGIPVSIWYDWKDDGTNPNEREHHFGTMTHELKPKATYLAAKTLSSTFAGYSIDQRLDLDSDNDFAFKLTKVKDRAVAVWTTGQEHKIKLPIETGEVRILNFLGQEENKTASTWKSGCLELTVSQDPQYLLSTQK